jgi:RNA polymerase I-specific transcription initiation factor RRN7
VISRDVWALNLCILPNPIHGDADGIHIAEEGDREPMSADADKSDPDPEIDQLLRENSESSDDSDDEERSRIPVHVNAGRKTKGVPPEEGPASTVAVLVVTCWLLRIPVMYQDFARYVCTCRNTIYYISSDGHAES